MNINITLTERQRELLKKFAADHYPGSEKNLATNKPIHLVQTRMERIVPEGSSQSGETAFIVPEWDYKEFKTPEALVADYYNGDTCEIPIISFEEACNTHRMVGIDGEEHIVFEYDDYFAVYGIEDDLYEKAEIEYYYRTVAVFFTLDEAKRYMQYQKHNLSHPRTYTISGGRGNNGDYEPFWDLLFAIGSLLNEGTPGKHSCPSCQSSEIEEARGGFIEISEYDETRQEYEEEYYISGYHCKACGRDFFV